MASSLFLRNKRDFSWYGIAFSSVIFGIISYW
jgi:hypothetical protein